MWEVPGGLDNVSGTIFSLPGIPNVSREFGDKGQVAALAWGPHICCPAEGEGQGLVAELHFGRGASRGKPRGGCGGAARGAVRGGNDVGVEGAHVHSQTPPPLLLKVVCRSPPLRKLADFFPPSVTCIY